SDVGLTRCRRRKRKCLAVPRSEQQRRPLCSLLPTRLIYFVLRLLVVCVSLKNRCDNRRQTEQPLQSPGQIELEFSGIGFESSLRRLQSVRTSPLLRQRRLP